ncbi:hypothetical protein SAMN04487910_0232 [Aquimarina amphilecti]|uniref:Uncharacterized protein n=1 Tax=Aquimarina amphilecti TaxID=1038014 RepID=A0A1H7FZT4_AQUAM|nr:hypothetical protein [Aquimarina amphilecti]SEK31566.1 hypothetical protein SAMN04487910_0232 [Aquimarina amphilecti]
MKTLILIITSLVLGLLTTNAQTTETSSSKSSSEISFTYDTDDENKKFYRSFVTLDMDNDYRIKIRFMKYMKSNVKSYLIDQFGKENLIIKEDTYLWTKELEDEEVYEVKLRGNRLRINVNKELASDKLIKRFGQIGRELKELTSESERS